MYNYFFRIGLYPSPISRVRMASASFTSVYGPSCTRNSLSVATWAATKAGYSFFFKASTNDSASSCLLTAATWTKYAELGSMAVDSLEAAAAVGAGAFVFVGLVA